MTNPPSDAIHTTARRAAAALGYGVALKVLRYGLAVASHIVIRRVLGPAEFGQYSVAVAVLDIAAVVASLGMGQALLRFLPEAALGRDPKVVRTLLTRSMFVQAIGWLGSLGLLWLFREPVRGWLRSDSAYELILLGMALLATRLLFDLGGAALNAVLAARELAIVSLLWQVAFVGGLLYLLGEGWGAEGVIAAGAWANAIGFSALIVAWRRIEHPPGARAVGRFTWRRILQYSVPFAAINVCYNLVWRNSEAFWINRYWDEKTVGLFSAAYNLPQLVLDFVPTAIWPLVMASYAAIFTVDRPRAIRLISHYYKLLFLLAAPLSIAGAVFGDRLLVVMYGPEYLDGGGLARLFFLIQCVSFLGTPLSMTLYVLEKTWMNLLVWLGAAALNVGLNVILIPRDWRLGSVLPVALAVSLMPIVYMILLRRIGVSVSVPWGFLLRTYLASATLLALLPLRSWARGAAELLVCAVVGVLLLAAGLKAVRIFRTEDRALLDLVPSAGARRALAWFGEGLR
jgi:O-antigen/teichoic acid export membrane protein